MPRPRPRTRPATLATLPAFAGQPLWRTLAVFVLAFGLLQTGWTACRDTAVERLVIHEATVAPAAALIRMLTPAIPARARAASILAPGGGLRILNGCEGTEVMFLLVAAFVAVPMAPRRWALALALGLAGVFVLNQARILVLFYAYRHDPALFETLHTLVLPLVLVAAVALYFHAVLRHIGHGPPAPA